MTRFDTPRRKVVVVAEKSPVVPKRRQTTGDGVYPYGMRFSAIQCDYLRLFVLDRFITDPLYQRLNLRPVRPMAIVHVHHGAAFLAPR